jgi:hypothetical protein
MKETERQFASHEEFYLTPGFSEQVLGFKTVLRTGITSFVRKVLRLSLKKIQNSTSQLVLPVPVEVVPSAVNTLLPAFLQVLKAAGECLFRNSCELHRRSRWSTRWPSFGALPLGLRVVLETPWFILGNDTVDELVSLPSFTQNSVLTLCSNRTSILLTAKLATGKGHGDFHHVLPPSGGRAT